MKNATEKTTVTEERTREFTAALIFGGLIALVGLGAGIHACRQTKRLARTLSDAAKNLGDVTQVDIRQSVVDRAVVEAATREAGRAVREAVRQVEGDIQSSTRKLVNSSVQRSYGKIKSAVSEAVARDVAKLDAAADILPEATERAKELLLERFDGKLDGLLADYQRNLDNVGRIYQSIASSMATKAQNS